jgi:hypothetical protein
LLVRACEFIAENLTEEIRNSHTESDLLTERYDKYQKLVSLLTSAGKIQGQVEKNEVK